MIDVLLLLGWHGLRLLFSPGVPGLPAAVALLHTHQSGRMKKEQMLECFPSLPRENLSLVLLIEVERNNSAPSELKFLRPPPLRKDLPSSSGSTRRAIMMMEEKSWCCCYSCANEEVLFRQQLVEVGGGGLHGVHLGTTAAGISWAEEQQQERQERWKGESVMQLEDVQDVTAATLEWSSILLRSYLMEAGLSMLEAPDPSPAPCEGSFLFDQEADDDDEVQWLDDRVWSRLPAKLVERVLACLPLPCFFRMRLVCKSWYHLLFSDSFLEVCAKVSPPRPWFLLFKQGDWSEAFVFDPVAKSWFRINLSFLPPRFKVVASAGGLLCCISEAAGCKTVLICNPLTQACVQLPSTLKERFVPTVGLVVDRESKAYKVMVAGDDMISPFAVKNLSTEFYDSGGQFWRTTSQLPRLCNLESGKTTYASGFFYCMNYSPFSVLAYDTEQGVWSKIQAPMRRFLRTPNLVECRGRPVLVAAVEKNKLNVPKSIRIWGLQNSKTAWVELERMPNSLYEEFMGVCGDNAFSCMGHGNLILITFAHTSHMLIYDFYEKVWRWSPRCPFLHATHAGFHTFSFDPRLEASVC